MVDLDRDPNEHKAVQAQDPIDDDDEKPMGWPASFAVAIAAICVAATVSSVAWAMASTFH